MCYAYLRAMLKTLVLLRMRCGCFDSEGGEGEGSEDSVLTYKDTNIFIVCCRQKNKHCPDKAEDLINKYGRTENTLKIPH